MGDDDLSSEAEAAAFIVDTQSKDLDIAEYTLDAWMALLIEQEVSYDADEKEIERVIEETVDNLPYKLQYSLSTTKLISIHKKLNNYDDVDSLYEFTDKVRDSLEEIQTSITRSLNQQFCRVRYGGQYNSVSGNNEIWFRISSVSYNWANTIYEFVANNMTSLKLESISICRDAESDGGFDNHREYFYKAKDGTLYKHMPIGEFLKEEHEHSMYFESFNPGFGLISLCRKLLASGDSYFDAKKHLSESYSFEKDIWKYLVKQEILDHCSPVTRELGFKFPIRR